MNAAESQISDEGWPWRKIFFLIALAIVVHLALIYFFGTKKQLVPRPVADAPHLQLADPNNELIALGNPTLFALPNPQDFSSRIWSKIPFIAPPTFRWTELPQWLPLDAENLGATFQQFMQTNHLAETSLDLKSPPEVSTPAVIGESTLPSNSTLKIFGALAKRTLTQPIQLPSWPYNNVILPSKIQVLVDAAGRVISAIWLPPNNSADATEHYNVADQRALELARHLRFAPANQLTLGEILFNWQTVPLPATNAVTQ